jgi:thioredoxin reductase (NADPH)
MYDITIIGAGIAGMTAAIYARRANKKVLVLEGKTYGGQIVETEKIENYPAAPGIAGPELAKKVYDQMMKFNPDFKYEKVLGISKNDDGFKILTDSGGYLSKTIIVATGTNYKKIGLENEAGLTGKGVSYCATCDGSLYRDKEIAVFGGGNSALYSVLYLSNLAKKVTIIHRRNEFRGDEALVEKVKIKENVEFKLGKVVSELKSENGKLSSIILTDVDTNETSELLVSALFVEIGREPENSIVKDFVELDEKGYIKSDENGKTSAPGIFAAGDCRSKTLRQIITASSDGAIAASSAIKYLNSK